MKKTLITPSRFDKFLKGDKKALTEQEKRGLKTFIEVGCVACHNGVLVGGNMYQKFGIFEPYWKYTKSDSIDEGRYVETKRDEDKYVFKVPSLRNVVMTPPYFHDGSKVQLGKDLTKEQINDIINFLKTLTGEILEEAKQPPILPP
ncbi:MAG: c-type cytochrome [candidate division WOR-3 bacterium]